MNDQHIFFVTPDIRRAIGLHTTLKNFHIICSYPDGLIPILRVDGADVFCLDEIEEGEIPDNSGKLLEHPAVQKYIKSFSGTPAIMFFKPSKKLDLLIQKMGGIPIGNRSELNEHFENKLLFYEFGQKYFAEYCIPSLVGKLSEMTFTSLSERLGDTVVIQFGHGWAGKTTFIVRCEKEFDGLQHTYPHTRVRISKFINGMTLLNNCCIYKGITMVSPPALQINGIESLHPNPAVTCGRQWPCPGISKEIEDEIEKISKLIGMHMSSEGFKGFFGIDFIISNQDVYVSEVNARLTASSGFYTLLEIASGHIPLLAYHIAGFLSQDVEIDTSTTPIQGSQITIRAPKFSMNDSIPAVSIYKSKTKQFIEAKSYAISTLAVDDAYILSRRSKKIDDGDEIARIETTGKAAASPHKLSPWVDDILRLF